LAKAHEILERGGGLSADTSTCGPERARFGSGHSDMIEAAADILLGWGTRNTCGASRRNMRRLSARAIMTLALALIGADGICTKENRRTRVAKSARSRAASLMVL
jgi:hypothetical protein